MSGEEVLLMKAKVPNIFYLFPLALNLGDFRKILECCHLENESHKEQILERNRIRKEILWETVDALIPAFGSPTGLPYSSVNPGTCVLSFCEQIN